ncbi:MAG: HAMP domain-containing protein [Desulforhopalus sp.]|nr:HAMP domain-containing protein [Desulforhopalus sp.]
MSLKLGIKQKLSLIFFLFFLIFSGTVSILLFNVQRMVETTEKIVIKNNKIDEFTEILKASLLDMDANHKKLKILKKDRYSEYFEQAEKRFEGALDQAVHLSTSAKSGDKIWRELEYSYTRHRTGLWDDGTPPEIGSKWVTEQVVSRWIVLISQAKRQNQQEIERALRGLNERSSISARNGLYGFFISIVVGFVGIWFITRSILTPLKTLAKALKRISIDKLHQSITLKGGEEFNELAASYNDMSRQLNEEENIRNEFIATLSHEIRTPLSSIGESVNMITEEVFGPINDKQRKFLKIASVEIKRIKKLLNYLLNVSVLESDVRKKKSARLGTRQLVQSSVEIFASFAEKKKVTLAVNDTGECPDLYGVREELQQVFVNLIGNAIKFSPEGGSVMVSWMKDKRKNFLLFQVSDTGPGIADDELTLVFTKYYRTKTARGHLDGVGLGLAISRKIVASYGGMILVTNNESSGCTFSFTLPTRPLG